MAKKYGSPLGALAEAQNNCDPPKLWVEAHPGEPLSPPPSAGASSVSAMFAGFVAGFFLLLF